MAAGAKLGSYVNMTLDPHRHRQSIVHLMKNGDSQLVAFGETTFHGSWEFDPMKGLWLRFNCKGPNNPEHMSRVFPTSSGQWGGWDYAVREIMMKPLAIYDQSPDGSWVMHDLDSAKFSGSKL